MLTKEQLAEYKKIDMQRIIDANGVRDTLVKDIEGWRRAMKAILDEACGRCKEPDDGICEYPDCGTFPFRRIARRALRSGE